MTPELVRRRAAERARQIAATTKCEHTRTILELALNPQYSTAIGKAEA